MNRVSVFFVAFAIALTPFAGLKTNNAKAASYSDIAYYQKLLDEARKQKQSYKNDVYILGLQIQQAQSDLKNTENEITVLTAEIGNLNKDIDKATKLHEQKKLLLVDALQKIEAYDDKSLIEVMVGSKNFNAFLNQVGDMLTIQKFLQQQVKDIKSLKTKLETYKAELVKKANELAELKNKQIQKKSSLDSSKNQKNHLVAVYSGKEKEYAKIISDLYRQLASKGSATCDQLARGSGRNTSQSVKRGQVIGYSGNSGMSSGPHLHFQVWNYVGRCQSENPMNKLSSGTFGWPVNGPITCGYHSGGGYCNSHDGVDIGVGTGNAVKAPYDGTIIFRRWQPSNTCGPWPKCTADYGSYVVLEHKIGSQTYYTLYAHLSRF